jgi:hypothetical protein
MIKAFFYDAEGEDREISLEKKLPQLGEQQLCFGWT